MFGSKSGILIFNCYKMKHLIYILFPVLLVSLSVKAESRIDRKAVVDRHKVVTTKTNPQSPAQVGNGEFAFGVDITGLQTFVPFNTMAQWSWHSFPLPEGMSDKDYRQVPINTYGRQVGYDLPNPDQPELSAWLAANPHRFNLGRIGLKLLLSDGTEAGPDDIRNAVQETDLWKGIITSRFELEGIPVVVRTACHPDLDMIGVEVKSDLIRKGRLSVFINFPYADRNQGAAYVGVYDQPEKHHSSIKKQTGQSVRISREMDDTHYSAILRWKSPAQLSPATQKNPHYFELRPSDTDKFDFTCLFTQEEEGTSLDENVFEASIRAWERFWNSGAAIDLSESSDPRWKELERRIVLSQYVMRVNEAGSLPPQESGLLNNGWYGRFHFEMIWWHGVHYALWDRWDLLDKSLHVYKDFLPTSRERARKQGYKGARWPKCTAGFDRDWPHIIHATLLWQQPHPIYFAELDYRLHPTPETLEKWRDVVFETADFMADFVHYDEQKNRYVLGPPVFIVSENTDPMQTVNPAFELGYWRFGLRVAQTWRKRMSLPVEKKWKEVEDKLSPLPVKDGIYTTYEDIPDMWTKYTFEHPALIGTSGMLPGDGVDRDIFVHTLDKVSAVWNFNHVWGWDFPMLAMAAARNGKPDLALDYLLHSSPNFQFDEHGLATGGPFPYFPSNGALLTAIAMMAGGWDGSTGDSPGFPKDGTWRVKAEGFAQMP